MRPDDGQARKIGCQRVKVDGACVIELDAHASWCSRAQPVRPRMKERGHAQFLNLLHQRIERGIIGVECLYAWMKFRPDQSQVLDSTLDFFNCCLSFVRINAGKADKLLWIA